MKATRHFKLILFLGACFAIFTAAGIGPAQAEDPDNVPKPKETVKQRDQTGTDPRGFAPKFMPYYRNTELENEIKQDELVLFGMLAFNPNFAMTFEMAVAKELDYTGFSVFQEGSPPGATFPPSLGGGTIPGAGVPFDDIDEDGQVVGIGDLNLRFFYKPPSWTYQNEKGRSTSWMWGAEIMMPTANEDILGNDTLIVSPMVTYVHDTPWHGFIAMMNFYDFDAFKERDRPEVSRYRGRWFLMQPLSKPGPGFWSGWYLLPELQPVYDWEAEDGEEFSIWLAPELGKIIAPGRILYIKPGWGIDPEPDSFERDFTFEVGARWFF